MPAIMRALKMNSGDVYLFCRAGEDSPPKNVGHTPAWDWTMGLENQTTLVIAILMELSIPVPMDRLEDFVQRLFETKNAKFILTITEEELRALTMNMITEVPDVDPVD